MTFHLNNFHYLTQGFDTERPNFDQMTLNLTIFHSKTNVLALKDQNLIQNQTFDINNPKCGQFLPKIQILAICLPPN